MTTVSLRALAHLFLIDKINEAGKRNSVAFFQELKSGTDVFRHIPAMQAERKSRTRNADVVFTRYLSIDTELCPHSADVYFLVFSPQLCLMQKSSSSSSSAKRKLGQIDI